MIVFRAILANLLIPSSLTLLLRSMHPSLRRHPRTRLFSNVPQEPVGGSDRENTRELLTDEKFQLQTALEKIDTLKERVEKSSDDKALLMPLEADISNLEEEITKLTLAILPPQGLSSDEFSKAIKLFQSVPFPVRLALCEALEIDDCLKVANDFDKAPEVVAQLYEERFQLTPKRLQDAMKEARYTTTKMRLQKNRISFIATGDDSADKRDAQNDLFSIFSGGGKASDEEEEAEYDQVVEQLLGRVTRKEGRTATQEDLATLTAVLGKDTFEMTESEAIPGGYVVRGSNTKESGQALIEALDEKLPDEWACQVSFLPDFTAKGLEAGFGEDQPVLVLLNKDMSSTTSQLILSLTSAVAVMTTFLFAVGVYGGNDVVLNRLTEGDYSGIDWFNGKVLEILIPLTVIQATHEFGHFAIAWKDKIKIAPPTLLPFWVLPYMGSKTQIKESPKSLTSLFDFAYVASLLGIITSLIFLVLGLQMTVLADPEATNYLPALPVSIIRLSTLGGTLIDNALGGNGFVTLQDSATAISLHPYAIAGFTGLVINAIDLLPLGSSNGGRISMALFGRQGNSVIGGTCWLFLLFSSLLSVHDDVLLGAFVLSNVAQNDQEVPCRDEVGDVDFPRALAAIGLWLVAILALTPMS